MERQTVIIVGGGPAGLFCAIHAACPGRNVIVLEKNPHCGRKLLITGSGQCNLTHDGDIREFVSHYGDHGSFLRPALMHFTNRDLMAFFEVAGLDMIAEPGGKIFPRTRRSADVLGVLLETCRQRGVVVRGGEFVKKAELSNGGFMVTTPAGSIRGEFLVLATGGASYPVTGSSGDGYRLARDLGLRVTDIAPALTAVVVREFPFSDLSGMSFTGVTVSLFREGRKIRDRTGDLLFTHTGLSGPVVLDLSRYILPGDQLKIAFIPAYDQEKVRLEFSHHMEEQGRRMVRTALTTFGLPDRLTRRLVELSGLPQDHSCAHLTRKGRNSLFSALMGFPCRVHQLCGFQEAMVTRGGVDIREIQPRTMESRLVPHLYIIGELLDIDGDSGGYNLQAAFSTGCLAGMDICSRIG
jgi:predicted Rossmann fold flavoprotein